MSQSSSSASSSGKSSRVDAEAFQAPEVQAGGEEEGNHNLISSSAASLMLADTLISSAAPSNQRAIHDFLLFTRNLNFTLGRVWDLDSVKTISLEEDELAIEYLAKYDFDASIAKFHFLSDIGAGQGKFLTSFFKKRN